MRRTAENFLAVGSAEKLKESAGQRNWLDEDLLNVLFLFLMSSRRRVPQNTAEYARWLAGEISRRYRDTWFARDTTMFVAMALEGIAAADNIEVAWAAYSSAVPKHARGRLVLHQSARIIARHPPEAGQKLLPGR